MSRFGQLATGPLLVALFAFFAIRETTPPRPRSGSLPPTAFSEPNAMNHVRAIAQRPHPVGSADHDRVRDYIMGQLTALGLSPRIQTATAVSRRYKAPVQVQNILARVPGTSGSPMAVLLMAHYDGVRAGPAASDDAAGCAALLDVLRAIRAGSPPRNNLIFLFTDGEEAGLLGAGAFVGENSWAKDVGVVVNLEARGTTGRAYMFQTGPGNLDVVRVLRTAPHVSAGSIFVTVYRALPNDTDLSRFLPLGIPALNFAFTGDVARYHTAGDDVEHLDPGSLQHEGEQALALARGFGDGPLPLPKTSDAVFFNLPVVGLVLYPVSWAVPLALLACALVLVVCIRVKRAEHAVASMAFGALGMITSVVVASIVALVIARLLLLMGASRLPSAPYTVAILLMAFLTSAAVYGLARRRAKPSPSPDAWHAGALVVWAALNLLVAIAAPGASYLLTWPLIVASLAALWRAPAAQIAAGWIAAFIVIAILGPLPYILSAVIMGLSSPAGPLAAAVVALTAWLLAPQLQAFTSAWSSSRRAPHEAATARRTTTG